MITREEAVALLNNALVGNPEPWSPSEADVWDANGAPVVGIQSTRLFAAAPDLARTVVALYDERAALRSSVAAALDTARMGTFDGAHHKMWVIDQMVRAMTGCPLLDGGSHRGTSPEYEAFVAELRDTYEWDTGISP